MDGMIDIHNHTLFGVDDGSKTFEQSKNMLKIAYEEGIRGIILTPHHNPYRWNNDISKINENYNTLKDFCSREFSDMVLYLGSELYYGKDTLEDLDDGKALTMAGGRYVLAEFLPSENYKVIKHAVMDIQQSGYYPILAHVERYECLLENKQYIDELKELGAFIQVNASGIMGERSRQEKKFIKGLLKRECVDFVATDAHRDDMRKPELKECAGYLEKKYGEEYTRWMLVENPQKVIKNQYIEE